MLSHSISHVVLHEVQTTQWSKKCKVLPETISWNAGEIWASKLKHRKDQFYLSSESFGDPYKRQEDLHCTWQKLC